MTSLKRTLPGDVSGTNLASKVYIRATRTGKVQKIVREVYLRHDIPCSSRLCTECLSIAPRDSHDRGEFTEIKRTIWTKLIPAVSGTLRAF